MPIVWVTGVSGTGKSTVAEALEELGHVAVDADNVGWCHWVDRDTGDPAVDPPDPLPPAWLARFGWRIRADLVEALAGRPQTSFLCGSAENEGEVWHLFDRIVCLVIDDDTVRTRLAERRTNDFGKNPDELAAVLAWNRVYEQVFRDAGAELVDATRPLGDVVAAVLAASMSGRRPRRGTMRPVAADRPTRVAEVVEWVRGQALAEPFYGVLLDHLADDIEAGGEGWRPFEQLADVPIEHNLPLRVMGAAHRLALQGEAPAFAAHVPTCGGDGDAEAAWPAFLELCASGALDAGVHAPVQTNECARTTTLLPGFGVVAAETGLPLRLLEVGSSAGLLLNLDRYHHELDDATWGPADSPVQLRCEGSAPLLPIEIVERSGCDPNPLDPVADREVLLSFVWPTQLERFSRLQGALDLAAVHPAPVDHANAGPWLAEHLAEPAPGVATVVFHSVVWQYIDPAEQEAITATIEAAGAAATADAPLAWLRLEPHAEPTRGAELSLRLWPSGEDRSLALCDYHGRWIRWGG